MTPLAVLIVLSAAAAGNPGPSTGALVIGPDVEPAGRLQREIDAAFASQDGLFVRRATALATGKLGGAADPGTGDRAKTRRRIAALVTESEAAVYEDHLDEALERLGAAIALQEQDPYLPAADRAKLILRRANAFLGLGNLGRADLELRAALSLVPDLKVDGAVFPPSLAERVAALRADPVPAFAMTLACHPETCRVRIDDRIVENGAPVPAGRHWLVASAPGFEDLARTIEVTVPATLDLALSLAVASPVEASLEAVLARGAATQADLDIFAAVARRVGLDELAVASIRGDSIRAAVWWRGMEPKDLRVLSANDLAERTAIVDEIAKRAKRAEPSPKRRRCWPF